ncbi:phosphoserine phosphatase SerB [Psychromicrobium sp. YIM B11713]|uniref:phosphoserine phosphatase SerB n=1 Tax=Psychromicrobium sp. YIM B11713 TaxID=3145233 RepID=UPI00374EB75B
MPTNASAFCYATTLTPATLEFFTGSLRDCGAALGASRTTKAADAQLYRVELDVDGELSALRSSLRTIWAAASDGCIAVVAAELSEQPRKLFVLDVDSTLIQQEVIELLAAHAGREAEVRAVTEAAMRGELDFAQSLRERVAALAGLPESVLAEVGSAIKLSPGAEALIQGAHDRGHLVAAVSGGFSQILEPLAERLGLDQARANELEISEGRLTGRVTGAIVDRAAKAQSLRAWAAEARIPLAATIAIGDGANDLDMLAAAGLSLAYRAKPAVREAADAQIDNLALALHLSDPR